MMPSLRRVSNSSFAIFSFSGERRLAWEWTGNPVVGIRCCTPCLGKSNEKVGVVNCGLSSRSLENSFVDVIAVILNDSCEERAPLIVLRLSLRMSLSLARSTRRQCERKKSPPMMGCVTSAIIKRQVYFWRPSVRIIRRVPNVLIGVPFAAMRCRLSVRLRSDLFGGIMLNAEPVSTRKYFPDLLS